jgi:hypothetical protein
MHRIKPDPESNVLFPIFNLTDDEAFCLLAVSQELDTSLVFGDPEEIRRAALAAHYALAKVLELKACGIHPLYPVSRLDVPAKFLREDEFST